jgi:Fe-S-cluster-containing dehydrogenase component
MPTSAEQFHHNLLNPAPAKAESRLLYIDLDVCTSGDCGSCNLKCSYASLEKNNNGIASVAELATMVLVCRKCEEAHCVAACPVEALERRDEEGKVLVRHNLRCVGCTSCSHACPYGTIFPENLQYLVHNCDFCLDRRKDKNEPLCISSCPHGALKLLPADKAGGENTYLVGDNLIVHCTHWINQTA